MTSPRSFDLSVYLVLDPAVAGPRDLVAIAEAAVEAGATLVQLRDKASETRDMLARAEALAARLRPRGVPLIINDRVDIALAVGADGVHLGQTDMPAAVARRLLGPDALLGLSVGSTIEAGQADPALVDYVGLGPVYPTGSKADAGAALGLDGFSAIRGLIELPVVAIAGITASNAGAVIRAGADGVAVISAICTAPDPGRATRSLAAAVEAARRPVPPEQAET